MKSILARRDYLSLISRFPSNLYTGDSLAGNTPQNRRFCEKMKAKPRSRGLYTRIHTYTYTYLSTKPAARGGKRDATSSRGKISVYRNAEPNLVCVAENTCKAGFVLSHYTAEKERGRETLVLRLLPRETP